MTATLSPGPAGRQNVQAAPARPAGRIAARRRSMQTAHLLLAGLVGLVVLSLGWGALGGWVAGLHSAAASSVVSVDEPLSLDAQQLYASIADADVTVTTMFLASSATSPPPLKTLQHYQGDIATAASDISELRAGGGQNQELSTALGTLATDLPLYTGYVSEARSAYALGYSPLGGSFLQVASEEAHLYLLPAARTVFEQENDALSAASSQATGLPTMGLALLLAVGIGFVLFRVQRWLTRRTRRVFNRGLALASVLLVVSAVWLVAGFLAARSDLDRGIGQGSQPVQDLAQASIGVQQIRGDAVLNVISRSGDTSFSSDFSSASRQVGPGPGSLLTAAAADQPAGGGAAAEVAAAERQASAWYAQNRAVYSLGAAADYAGEREDVIGTGAGTSAAGYASLQGDITTAIGDDQAALRSAASAGAGKLNPLEPVVIAASLLMALCCAWGMWERFAEYR